VDEVCSKARNPTPRKRGSPLFSRLSAMPEIVGVRAGSLDDPSLHRPVADIFIKSAQPWDYMNPELPKYPGYRR
jgi:hypothetical protein